MNSADRQPMRSEREFSFELPGTVAAVTPYFGPVKESEWAPDWKPVFVFPQKPDQVVGAVFETVSEWGHSIWTMDRYDPDAGRVGYVIFVGGIGVTRYDITLAQVDARRVRVRVWCSRTRLGNGSPGYIGQFQQSFVAQGPEWQRAIRAVLTE